MKIKIAISRFCIRYGILLFLLVLCTGCFQTKQTVWLNPDGSGKMEIDAFLPVITLFEQEPTTDSLKKQMQKDVKGLISESSGIDAWSGVSYEMTEGGQNHFKGTAYFRNISEVRVKNITQGNISFLPDEKGSLILLVKEEPKKKADVASRALTEEEILEKIKTEKIKFRQAKPMLASFLADFKTEVIFHLPGKVVSSVNLKEYSGGAFGFALEGRQIIDALNVLASDDNWWRRQVSSSANIMQDSLLGEEDMNEKLLGEKGPIKAVVSVPTTPLFDYSSEFAYAKKESDELKKKLDIDVSQPADSSKKTIARKDAETTGETMWKPDLADAEIPAENLHGIIRGRKFQCEKAVLENNILHLRQGKEFFADLEIIIFFFLKENETIENRIFDIASDKKFGNPHVHMKWKDENEDMPKTEIFMKGYSMRIEFGANNEGRLPGKIYLCLPDEGKSAVAGKFEAEVK